MPFNIALSGLTGASADLKVTGNNIANSNTYGFKESRAEFVDIFAVSYGGISSIATGAGTRLADVAQQFSQGNVDFTENNLDIAINGLGFFVLDDDGTRILSRAGAFRLDRDGNVVNSSGHQLQVFPAVNTASGTTFDTGALSNLQLSTSEGAPSATTQITQILNLDASESIPPNFPVPGFNPTDPDSYNSSTSLTVYDSLGSSHPATQYFVKTGPNTWNAYLYIEGSPVTFGGGNPNASLTFNPDGSFNNVAPPTLPLSGQFDTTVGLITPLTGANEMTLRIDYTDMTQYGSDFAVNALSQDGYATGRLTGIDVDPEGVVSARFSNGQSQVLGKLAMANVANPQGLQPLGDTVWGETFKAGDTLYGEANTASFGLFQSGALEASNVDVAEQLVNLIIAQRNFQANAQVVSTADTVTQTIINI